MAEYTPGSTDSGRKLTMFSSAGKTVTRTIESTMIANTAPTSACSAPSVTNGPRMKPLVAPTSRMIEISRLRARIARRIVLLRKTSEMNTRSTTATIHA